MYRHPVFVLAAISTLLWVGISGCGSYRTHRLPLPAVMAPATFPSIASAAREMGLQAVALEDAVHVQLDEATWVYYTIQMDEYNLVIHIDEEKVAEPEREARFLEARHKADQIWNRAVIGGRLR